VHVGGEHLNRPQRKRGAHELDAELAASRRQRREKFLRQLPLRTRAMRRALRQNLGREQFVHLEQLELHGCTADPRRRLDEVERSPKIAAVIARHLRNEPHCHQRYAETTFVAASTTSPTSAAVIAGNSGSVTICS